MQSLEPYATHNHAILHKTKQSPIVTFGQIITEQMRNKAAKTEQYNGTKPGQCARQSLL